jgi:hypothetical protein
VTFPHAPVGFGTAHAKMLCQEDQPTAALADAYNVTEVLRLFQDMLSAISWHILLCRDG